MEKDIKRNRQQTPETREKISNSQRMRFAKLNRALKENEVRKLELKNPNDNVPLDDYELFLELKFQLADEIDLMIDAMFQLFKHQLGMERKSNSNDKANEILEKVDLKGIVDRTIKNYLDNNLIKNEDD